MQSTLNKVPTPAKFTDRIEKEHRLSAKMKQRMLAQLRGQVYREEIKVDQKTIEMERAEVAKRIEETR